VAPNAASLSADDREHAWKMAQEVTDHFMAMQEDQVAYCTSLEPEFYFAAEREIQFALQVGDRLVRVMKYFHAESEEVKTLEGRLTDMEAAVEAYERNLIDLGDFEF